MSRMIQGILIAAALLIVVASIFDSRFVVGGSGLVLLVGIGYAYVVGRRDVERGGGLESGSA